MLAYVGVWMFTIPKVMFERTFSWLSRNVRSATGTTKEIIREMYEIWVTFLVPMNFPQAVPISEQQGPQQQQNTLAIIS